MTTSTRSTPTTPITIAATLAKLTECIRPQLEAVEKLAEAFNGHNPREDLLRQAARSGGSGKVDG